MIRPLPISTLFPYTTLFRSDGGGCAAAGEAAGGFAPGAAAGFSSSVGARLPILDRSGPIRSCPSTTGRSDRKSTRLNSSHTVISYAVFCLKKKKQLVREQHI